jgi:hypothetical protein
MRVQQRIAGTRRSMPEGGCDEAVAGHLQRAAMAAASATRLTVQVAERLLTACS